MDLLFLGYTIDEKNCDKLHGHGVSVAGNNMQLGIIEGLYNIIGSKLKVISVYPISSFPKTKRIWVKGEYIYVLPNIKAKTVSFLNIPVVKQFWIVFSTYFLTKKLIKKNKNCKIITFNAFPHVGLAAKWLSKKYGIETICILADLPIDVIKRNIFGRFLRKIMEILTLDCIKSFTKNIVLNKNAAILFAPNKPYLVIDGGISCKDCINQKNKNREMKVINKNEKIILFTGTLNKYNGIYELIEAMKYIKFKDIKLHIYGDGPLSNYVKELANKFFNIEYKGLLPNKEIRRLQASADLLINPRPIDNPISKVTFPSKLIEYMLSGTPVLTSDLPGLTEEYKEKVFLIEKIEAISIANSIDRVFSLPKHKLTEKGLIAKNFIINNKTWSIQTKKIYDFIK